MEEYSYGPLHCLLAPRARASPGIPPSSHSPPPLPAVLLPTRLAGKYFNTYGMVSLSVEPNGGGEATQLVSIEAHFESTSRAVRQKEAKEGRGGGEGEGGGVGGGKRESKEGR